MRFGFLFSGVFWGTMLILLGISIILKVMFNISIPFFRLFFAFFFVYLGLQILIGKPPQAGDRRTVVFGERTVRADERDAEYHAVFGRGLFDLSGAGACHGQHRVRRGRGAAGSEHAGHRAGQRGVRGGVFPGRRERGVRGTHVPQPVVRLVPAAPQCACDGCVRRSAHPAPVAPRRSRMPVREESWFSIVHREDRAFVCR